MKAHLKKILITSAFLSTIFCCSSSLFAQIELHIQINNKNFISYEKIWARLTFRNHSAHPIIFGENKQIRGKLLFDIEGRKSGIIPLRGKVTPPITGLILPAGGTKQLDFEVTKYYNVYQKDRYHIKAVIEHARMPKKYESNSATFNIGGGVVLWERTLGVPHMLMSKSDDKIKTRTVKVISFFDGSRKIFYLIIEDKKMIYLVRRIGYDIGASKPDCDNDRMNRVHIIIQASPKVFSYFVYDLNGTLDLKERYLKNDLSPRLVRDPKTGAIVVAGGERAIEDLHYKEESSGTLFKEGVKKNHLVPKAE